MRLSAAAGRRAKRASTRELVFAFATDYLAGEDADRLFGWLLENAPWQTERFRLYGRSIEVPRLVAWFGEPGVGYRYSGTDHCAVGWPDRLRCLVERVRAECAPDANFLLLNRYRNGTDSMGWHTDDESEIADPVVSISLGATRRFHLRETADARTECLDLSHGSLLVHGRSCPHAVPKTRRPVGERINLSFRTVVLR